MRRVSCTQYGTRHHDRVNIQRHHFQLTATVMTLREVQIFCRRWDLFVSICLWPRCQDYVIVQTVLKVTVVRLLGMHPTGRPVVRLRKGVWQKGGPLSDTLDPAGITPLPLARGPLRGLGMSHLSHLGTWKGWRWGHGFSVVSWTAFWRALFESEE